MDYHAALRKLRKKAGKQGNFKIPYRDSVDLNSKYAAHLHGTYVWVSKREWDKLDLKQRLDPKRYTDVSDDADDRHTYAIPLPDTPIYLKLFGTDIATFNPDGSVVLRAGGHEGPTTKKWLPVPIASHKASKWDKVVWAVRDSDGNVSRFYDGITLDRNGHITSKIVPPVKHAINKEKSKAWHAATRQLREQAGPLLSMLDGAAIPQPIVHVIENVVGYWDPKRTVERVMEGSFADTPEDHAFVARLCIGNYFHWIHNKGMRLTETRKRFDQSLRTAYAHWVRLHGLVKIR